MAIAAMIAMIITTTSSSTSEKPFCDFMFFYLQGEFRKFRDPAHFGGRGTSQRAHTPRLLVRVLICIARRVPAAIFKNRRKLAGLKSAAAGRDPEIDAIK